MAYSDENGGFEPGSARRSQRRERPVRSRPVRSPEAARRARSASASVETPSQAVRRRKQSSRFVDPRARRMRRRRIVSVVLAVLLLLIAGGGVAAYAFIRSTNDTIHPSQVDQAKVAPEIVPKAPGQPFYMVIMGEDTRPGEKQARSDTLIVAHVDPQAKTVAMMSIPRDSRVAIPGHGTDKINAAAQIGGAPLTIKTVTAFTGLPISHYVILDFNGFKSIVDAMGGVVLDVPFRIDDLQAANHIPSARVIEKGVQRLDGAHALTFVRARHQFPSQDIQRMANQQYFMKELVKQAKVQAANPFKTFAIVNAFARAVKTDLTIQELAGLALDFKGMQDSSLQTVTMPGGDQTINGISYIIPNISGMKEIVRKMEAGLPIDPKAAAAAATATATLTPVAPATVQVAVRNGAGVSGLSKQASDILLKAGFKIPETGNMSQFVYPKTIVVYKTDAQKAKAVAVAQSLGQGELVVSRGMYSFVTDVLVVVGKDWDAKKAPGAAKRP
jgi:polyisoprenyl-teichoic acid--peptidoglycan teichoic acid transferase